MRLDSLRLRARNVGKALGVTDSELSRVEDWLADEFGLENVSVTYQPRRVGYAYHLTLPAPIDTERMRSVVEQADGVSTEETVNGGGTDRHTHVMDTEQLDGGGKVASAKAAFEDGQQTVTIELLQTGNGSFEADSSNQGTLEVLQRYYTQ